MAEREKLQTAEYELSGKGVDSRSKNPAYREYMGAVADDVTQNQIQDKRASLKLQDDDSLIPAIGKLGGWIWPVLRAVLLSQWMPILKVTGWD